MTISVWGYTNEYEEERHEILEAADRVFRSGMLVLGGSVTSFEQEFAQYCQVEHGVGVDNGTNAIVLGLRALGVGRGDEVITVANTAAPTVVAIDAVGATPVFVDVDPHTCLMDTDALPAAITDRTRCILPVHLYGQCVAMAPVLDLAAQHGLSVLEDCAQAHGAHHQAQIAGSMGDAAAFSFYPTKVLGAYGDAGLTVTSDDKTAAALRRLRYYGMVDRYYVESTPGHNSRLDEVHAEILRGKLTRLDRYIAARRAIAARYEEGLSDTALGLPLIAPGNDHVYYLYVVRHPERDRIIKEMSRMGVELNISYPWPVHRMRGFAHLGYEKGSLPVTEALADEVFSLPMYPSLRREEQEKVISALRKILSDI